MNAISALRSPRRRLAPKLAAGLLLFAVLAGGVATHSTSSQAAAAGAGGAPEPPDRCVTGAIAHDQTHLEACGEPELPACPGCLHHLAVRGLHLPRVTSLRTDPEGIRLPVAAADRLPSDPCFRWIGGRSPPLA